MQIHISKGQGTRLTDAQSSHAEQAEQAVKRPAT